MEREVSRGHSSEETSELVGRSHVAKGRTERRVYVANLDRVLQTPASVGPAPEGRVKLENTAKVEIHTLGEEGTSALRSAGSGNLNVPNRRIRTRTYGGVGGE
jgi:hypothetical protein